MKRMKVNRLTRRGFSLVELLVVIGLMGMLATISIGGYVSATRGMNERAVKDDTVSFMRTAMQRSLIDWTPTAIVFYNQRLREATDFDAAVVVGKAVAVKRAGRITNVSGSVIVDEFADWRQAYPPASGGGASSSSLPPMPIYRMANLGNGGIDSCRSLVNPSSEKVTVSDYCIVRGEVENSFPLYGLRVRRGFNSWQVGDPYGVEVASFQLPYGYIFGTSVPTDDQLQLVETAVFVPDESNPRPPYFSNFPTISLSQEGGSSFATITSQDFRQN